MFPSLYNTAVNVEAAYLPDVPENSEEYAERYGQVVQIPGLKDRIFVTIGQIFIRFGQKLTESGTKNLQVSKDMA